MEALFDSLTSTHLWFGLLVLSVIVDMVAMNWLQVDLEERGLHERRTIGNDGLELLKKGAEVMVTPPDSSTQLKYGGAVITVLTCTVFSLLFFYKGFQSLDTDPCDEYSTYLNYSVDDTFSYRVKEGRRTDPVGIWLNSGPLDPCTYRLPDLYYYLNSGDLVRKAAGDSVLYVHRNGSQKEFIGTKLIYGCAEN